MGAPGARYDLLLRQGRCCGVHDSTGAHPKIEVIYTKKQCASSE